MSNPQIPATTMATKATTLAFTGGNAVGPVRGSAGRSSRSGTRRS